MTFQFTSPDGGAFYSFNFFSMIVKKHQTFQDSTHTVWGSGFTFAWVQMTDKLIY